MVRIQILFLGRIIQENHFIMMRQEHRGELPQIIYGTEQQTPLVMLINVWILLIEKEVLLI